MARSNYYLTKSPERRYSPRGLGVLAAAALLLLLSSCTFVKVYKRDEKAPAAVQAYLQAVGRDIPKSMSAVIALGPLAMPDLRDAFATESSAEKKTRILHAAATIAKPASLLESIFAMGFTDIDPSVRHVSTFRAGQFPSLAPQLHNNIRALLRDNAQQVRSAAFSTLGSFPAPYNLTPEELIRGMRDADFGVAAQASAIASKRPEEKVQQEARQSLVNLLSALEEPSPATRAAVVYAFGQYGKKAAAVIQPLTIFMQREQIAEVKLQAALALVRIGTPASKKAATPTLQMFAKSKNPFIRTTAVDALTLAEGKK